MIIRLLIVFLLSSVFAYAQPQVSISDTSLRRGERVRVPLLVSLSAAAEDTVHIQIRYKHFALKLLSAEPDIKTAIRIDTSEVVFPADSTTILQLSIYPIGGTLIDKTLGYLSFEALAFSDSVTRVEPILLRINNRTLDNTLFDSGIFRFPDPPISAVTKEYLTIYSPHPFQHSITFRYFLLDRSDVHFTLFNLNGREISTASTLNEAAGIHEYVLQIVPQDVSSGVYHLRMQTKNGIYIQQCMVIK